MIREVANRDGEQRYRKRQTCDVWLDRPSRIGRDSSEPVECESLEVGWKVYEVYRWRNVLLE